MKKQHKHTQKHSRSVSPPSLPYSSYQLFHNAHFLQDLLEYIGDELVILDHNGQFVFVNDAMVQGAGYSRGYILKRNVTDFLSEKMSVKQWKRDYFEALKKKKAPISYRIERISRGQDVRVIDITAVYIAFNGHEFVLSIGRDVTRQVQLQRALQDSKNLYRLLAEGAGDGIAALNLNGQFTYANRTLLKMFEISPKQYTGRKFSNFIHKKSFQRAKDIFAHVRAGKGNIQDVIDVESSSGEPIPVEVNVAPLIKNNKVVSIHVIVRDLRPRLQMEQMSRQSEKMDALRYFIAGTAQELRNPLLGVLKRADKLVQKYSQRSFEYIGYKEFMDIMRNIESIRDYVRYCYETAHRLTAVGQKKAGIKSGFSSVNDVIRQLVRDKENYLKQQDVIVRLQLTSRNPDVCMNALDFMQILNNIMDNAIQAMPSGGKIVIKTALAPQKNDVLIEISDQGVGIPKDQMDHIFEPFFTTKVRGIQKNSGLGLPIVYSLIRSVQGDLQVISSLRKGTTVKISLPVSSVKGKS